MSATESRYHLPTKAALAFWALALVGGVALAEGLVLEPERTWVEVLVISNYLAGLGLGGLLLVALLYVTGARWSNPLRRVPEAMTAVLPLAAVGLFAVWLFRPSLYVWTLSDYTSSSESPLQHFWLNRPFFLIRALAYFALWFAFTVAIVRNSRQQDSEQGTAPTGNNIRLSAAFLVVFGVTCWLASYDWIMSLEPEWASTIFGVYNFAGLFIGSIAVVILMVNCLRRYTHLRTVISDDHLHDLGTLLFAFSSFWMYCWFCQYMLIWYVNNPEETAYFRRRQQGDWPVFLLFALALNWGVPFLVLLFRSAKRSPLILGTVAIVVLIGRWVDLYVMIAPSQSEVALTPGAMEGGLFLGAAALFLLIFFRALSKASLVPIQAPSA